MKKLHGAAKRICSGLQSRLSKLARFGQSKHAAKQAAKEKYLSEHGNLKGYNPSKVEGIFSIGTMQTYRDSMAPFAEWLAKEGAKNAARITRDQAISYLKFRQGQGLSAWTVSRDMSAINKALGMDITKSEAQLKPRSVGDITRSRYHTANDNRSFKDCQEQITIAKACGCRRSSMTRITPKDCQRNASGLVVGIRVVEKGGKARVAPVLNSYKAAVTDIVNRASAGTGGSSRPIFNGYDSHVDNHALRAGYCSNLMRQLEQEKAQGVPWFGGDLNPADYIHLRGADRSVGEMYRGHPTDAVAATSGAMGHNRLEIIFSHYNYA